MVIIEKHNQNGVEYILSFTSSNPNENECYTCKSFEDAENLKILIETYCRI